ncbi:hypothetical protein [Thiolapillus sp.]
MKLCIPVGGLCLFLLSLAGSVTAAPYIREASFHRVFDGTNFYGEGKHLPVNLAVFSSNGKVAAFYGWDGQSAHVPQLFVHNFESTTAPTAISLPSRAKYIDTFAGLAINNNGSNVFLVAFDRNTGDDLFYKLDTTTHTFTLLLDTAGTSVENPNDIATDGNGDYLYFNESDSGYRNEGDLWRVAAGGSTPPQLVLAAASIPHPTKGFGRFIGEFDVSDDGNTIAFILDGWQTDTETSTNDRELFVRTAGMGGPVKNLTNNYQNNKSDLRISGDGSTIVYTGRDVKGEVSVTGAWDWMTIKTSDNLNQQVFLEDGYHSAGDDPSLTTDGRLFLGRSNPNGVSAPDAYLIRTDGIGRLKIDTDDIWADGVNIRGAREGMQLSGDGTRVFFKQDGSYGGSIVSLLYAGMIHNNAQDGMSSNLWPGVVPNITSINYPAPLAFGTASPDDFPAFKISIGVNDPQGIGDLGEVDHTLLRFNGYPDDGGYGPVRVKRSGESGTSPGLWEVDGYRGKDWPIPPADPSYADYYDDPMEIEVARFSVKDKEGNVAYRDVVLQAAEGGCSGSGTQTLSPEDLSANKDVSCIADGKVETNGPIVISADMLLYLSAPEVLLNPDFSVKLHGLLKVE